MAELSLAELNDMLLNLRILRQKATSKKQLIAIDITINEILTRIKMKAQDN